MVLCVRKIEEVTERVIETITSWIKNVEEQADRKRARIGRKCNQQESSETMQKQSGRLNRLTMPKPWRGGMQVVKDLK